MSRQRLVLGIAIGILLVFTIVIYQKINELERNVQRLSTIQQRITDLQQSIERIDSNVRLTMDEFLEQQLWVQEKKHTISEVRLDQNEIDVVLTFSLRDVKKQEKIALLVREKSTSKWTELEVSNETGLNYTVEKTFSLRGNYETQVIATSTTGQRSENLVEMDFKDQLENRIDIIAHVHHGLPNHISMNIDITNSLEQNFIPIEEKERLKIQSAQALLYIDGKLLKEIDLLHSVEQFGESIFYQDSFTLEEEVLTSDSQVELHILVEDRLGMEIERKAKSIQ